MTQQRQHSKKAIAEKQTAAKRSMAKHQEEQGAAPEERHRMIAEAAYLISEQREFQGDMALEDWLQAEAEVDARFAARH